MAVAANADLYAEPRQNIFFSGVVPSLDGQCVSLVKWFMQEMTGVPNPQAARGDARYVGKTLVAQGHAIEVPYGERRRGDIICYEYGAYGHIAVQLSGGRVFEQNVNLGGVQSKIVDGARVYASRIGSENEAFRQKAHVYRIKTYKEGEVMAIFTSKPIAPDLVRQHLANFTNGRAIVKNTDPVCQNRFELNDENWGGEFWKGLNFQQLDIIRQCDKTIADLEKQISTGVKCTPDERAYLDALKKIV